METEEYFINAKIDSMKRRIKNLNMMNSLLPDHFKLNRATLLSLNNSILNCNHEVNVNVFYIQTDRRLSKLEDKLELVLEESQEEAMRESMVRY